MNNRKLLHFSGRRIFKEPVFLRAKSHGANGKHRLTLCHH